MENGQRILQKCIFISSHCRHLQTSSPESLTRGFALGPHWGKVPDPFYRLAFTSLAQILSSYIVPSRSLRSSSTAISAPLRKTSIATSRSFSSTASYFWDKLPVHVSSASTVSVFSRQAPFIPSCLTWIHYTDHQSRNLLKFRFVHLTRSSPADSRILAWVLLDTGACANAALLTHLLTY